MSTSLADDLLACNMDDAVSCLEALGTSSMLDRIMEREAFAGPRRAAPSAPGGSLRQVLCASDALEQLQALAKAFPSGTKFLQEPLPSGATPLETAVGAGSLRVSKWLVEELGGPLAPSLLLRAARGRNRRRWEVVVWLVSEEGLSANTRDLIEGTTVLQMACSLPSPLLATEMAQFLVKAGADANVADAERETPLLAALRAGNLDLAAWLVSPAARAMSDCLSRRDNATPLSLAVEKRAPALVRTLLEAGAVGPVAGVAEASGGVAGAACGAAGSSAGVGGKNSRIGAGAAAAASAAATAAGRGRTRSSSSGGSSSGSSDGDGSSSGGSSGGSKEIDPLERPLCLAAGCGDAGIVALLADCGAATAAAVAAAATTAALEGHLEVVKLLVERGGHANEALHGAAANGWIEVVKWLVDEAHLPADGTSTETGHFRVSAALSCRTPLMLSCRGGHLGVAEFLVSRGADVGARDTMGRGWSALEWACAGPEDSCDRRAGHMAVVRFLLESAGAEFDASGAGRSPAANAGSATAAGKCTGSDSSSRSSTGISKLPTSSSSGGSSGSSSGSEHGRSPGGSALHAVARTAWKAPDEQAEIARYLLSGKWADALLQVAFPRATITVLGGRPLPRDVENTLRAYLAPNAASAVRARDAGGRTPLEVAVKSSFSTFEIFRALVEAGAEVEHLSKGAAAAVKRALAAPAGSRSGGSGGGGGRQHTIRFKHLLEAEGG